MQTNLHFNTIGLKGKALVKANQKACNQAERILEIFREYPRADFTPWIIMKNYKRIFGKPIPITSVRARLTTLTENNQLIKSEKAEVKGIYGTANHVWKLRTTTE